MNYFTSYFAKAYNPALANYHLQDSDLLVMSLTFGLL